MMIKIRTPFDALGIFVIIILSTYLLGQDRIAYAFHFPWDQGHDTFKPAPGDGDTAPGDDGPCKSGSPVEVTSGNFLYHTRDLILASLGPAIDMTRYYNGRDMRSGPFGIGWVFPYDQRLIEITDGIQVFAICSQPNGKRETFTRLPDGSYAPPLHVHSSLVKNSDGSYTLRASSGISRQFNPDGKLVAITDRNDNSLTFTYDSAGFPTSITDAVGRTIQLSKGANGRIEGMTDPAGRIFRYGYDSAGNLTSYIDPLGNTTTYQYDSKNNLIAIIDPRGNRIIGATYDSEGRVATLVEGGETWTYSYQPTQKRTIKSDSAGNTWTYEYNDQGGITRRVDPFGSTELYTFDSNLNITEYTDKNGNKTTSTYDAMGNVLTITDTLGNTSSYTYEPIFNTLLTLQDAAGNVTHFEYDSRGNLTRSINPLGQATVFEYNTKGQLVRETDAAGISTSYAYDSYGNLAQITDSLGQSVNATYNVLGNLLSTTDREGRSGQFSYDNNERLIQTVDALGGVTTDEYDTAGNLTAITLPNGARTTFEYDSLNRRTRVTNSLDQSMTFTYDRRSNVASRTDASGQQIQYAYDTLDRLVLKTKPEETVTYTYDRFGNLLTVEDDDSSLTFVYDALHHITEARTGVTAGQPATTIRFSYDTSGNRKTMTDPMGGVTNYAYDALLRLTSLTDPSGQTFTLTYDAASRRTHLDRSLGLVTTYSYDMESRPLSVLHQSGAGDLAFNATYDRVGNRVSVADSAGVHSFSYDPLYRLIVATHPSGSSPAETYTYDAMGNRTASHLSAVYSHDSANRLTADAQFDYTYDANGNLTHKTERASGQVTVYTYDSENRMIRIDLPNGTSVTYRYDGLGRRVEKNVNDQAIRYVYDSQDILVEYSASGVVNARYTHGPGLDEVLAVQRGTTTALFELDTLGSVARVIAGATVMTRYDYDSFGRLLSQTGTALAPYAFQGRELDQESGLYYYRARYYDPQVGRFLSEDPIGFAGGINFYQFVGNNPINWLDPLGLEVGLWESMIPIWGSGKQAYEDFNCGRWGWGLFNTAFAISDVFLVKSAVTGIAKGAFKIGGSHTWDATRSWLNTTGRVEFKGQHFHHWLFERNQGIGQYVPDVIKNQPWNLMGMPGSDFATSNAYHQWLHHGTNPAERLWYGTPAWAKAASASAGGRGANAARGKDECCP